MKNIVFKPFALAQFNEWVTQDTKTHSKILTLLENILETPFAGIGKPEPLKHELSGCWSRRITKEHRLVYQVTNDAIIVISCKMKKCCHFMKNFYLKRSLPWELQIL